VKQHRLSTHERVSGTYSSLDLLRKDCREVRVVLMLMILWTELAMVGFSVLVKLAYEDIARPGSPCLKCLLDLLAVSRSSSTEGACSR